MSAPSARRDAFTLLEVMAAVLILGLLYAVLAEAAIRGLRSEGVSRRKVEASLIADRFLADLEAQLALGQIPKSGQEEQEVDVYRVGINVQPFDPTPILDAIEKVEKERGIDKHKARPKKPEEQNSMEVGAQTPGAVPTEDLLAPPRTGQEGRLRRIDVSVTWQDGEREEHVSRTTFAFDTSGLEQLFPKKGEGVEAGAGTGEDGGTSGTGRGAKKPTKSGQKPTMSPLDKLPVQQEPGGR
ncbi:MAG TPA: type II secretion system protein [Myxococcota bacterium]|nr:type II secretion system protein [Myxococcota bacterium]